MKRKRYRLYDKSESESPLDNTHASNDYSLGYDSVVGIYPYCGPEDAQQWNGGIPV